MAYYDKHITDNRRFLANNANTVIDANSSIQVMKPRKNSTKKYYHLTMDFTDKDYATLRVLTMKGKFNSTFIRDTETGVLTITTQNRNKTYNDFNKLGMFSEKAENLFEETE